MSEYESTLFESKRAYESMRALREHHVSMLSFCAAADPERSHTQHDARSWWATAATFFVQLAFRKSPRTAIHIWTTGVDAQINQLCVLAALFVTLGLRLTCTQQSLAHLWTFHCRYSLACTRRTHRQETGRPTRRRRHGRAGDRPRRLSRARSRLGHRDAPPRGDGRAPTRQGEGS